MSGHTYTHTYIHTHTHTHTHTYTHDNYYNPRCAHAHRGLIIIQATIMTIYGRCKKKLVYKIIHRTSFQSSFQSVDKGT